MSKHHHAWLWLPLRLALTGAWILWMFQEWRRWPNGSPVLGPLGLAWYGGFDWPTIVFCAISAVALLAFLLKPHPVTAFISILGALNWLFWGKMAEGIGC